MDGPIIDQKIIGVVLGNGVLTGLFFLVRHGARGTGALGDVFYLMAFSFTSYTGASEVMDWEWVGRGSPQPARHEQTRCVVQT